MLATDLTLGELFDQSLENIPESLILSLNLTN
uniref:Uncharacterized protein n=1 Tax=viral metagenome TaxID=1070528 RepID=A0A6C0C5W3_9ZZZZ